MEWDAIEVAAHAMDATSLSQLTPPEVRRMAARALRDQGDGPGQNSGRPEPAQIAAEVTKR